MAGLAMRGGVMIGSLVKGKYSGNLGVIVQTQSYMYGGCCRFLIQFSSGMKVWLDRNEVEVLCK